jgi:hypothetical protein
LSLFFFCQIPPISSYFSFFFWNFSIQCLADDYERKLADAKLANAALQKQIDEQKKELQRVNEQSTEATLNLKVRKGEGHWKEAGRDWKEAGGKLEGGWREARRRRQGG